MGGVVVQDEVHRKVFGYLTVDGAQERQELLVAVSGQALPDHRPGERVIRIAPSASVRSRVGEERWSIRAKSVRYQIDLDGDGAGLTPHVLPVPLPAERRNVGAAVEHLAGRLHCVVREFGQVVFDGTSELAGLEVGSLPADS